MSRGIPKAAWFCWILATVTWIATSAGVLALSTKKVEDRDQFEVWTGVIYRVITYSRWPGADASNSDPFVFCLLGNGSAMRAFERYLDEIPSILGRPLRVRVLEDYGDDFGASVRSISCQALIVTDSRQKGLVEMLRDLDGADILTIGRTDDFISSGGMIRLFLRGESEGNRARIGFLINKPAVDRTRIQLDSNLLDFAKRYDGLIEREPGGDK